MLKLTGREIEQMGGDGIELSDLDRIEWYRYVTRITRNALERFIENAEPRRPRLIIHTWQTSVNVANPDQDHLLAEFNPAIQRTIAFVQSDEIHFDADGNFEVSGRRRKARARTGCRRRRSSRACSFASYSASAARSVRRACTSSGWTASGRRPSTRPTSAGGSPRAGEIILGDVDQARAWWKDNLEKRPSPLKSSKTFYLTDGGVNDRELAFGLWRKAADQARVLAFTPPACDSWLRSGP